jgi:hypothetical protein
MRSAQTQGNAHVAAIGGPRCCALLGIFFFGLFSALHDEGAFHSASRARCAIGYLGTWDVGGVITCTDVESRELGLKTSLSQFCLIVLVSSF